MEPWEIFGNTYFFTELKKKTVKGKWFARMDGKRKGSWKGQDKGKPIQNGEGIVIGYKRSLRYDEEDGEREWFARMDGNWRGSWKGQEKDLVVENVEFRTISLGTLPSTITSRAEPLIYHEARAVPLIYHEDAQLHPWNLHSGMEESMHGFPEDLMIKNMESTAIPIGALPLTFTLPE
ncbi:unnamed protein product [Ilex paraguariensis]|uniref:NAC domain-containing protein n=1 Tax=Ilex paraguariensis TaxID=185542 RepID=A0ABC8R862_9AQUA